MRQRAALLRTVVQDRPVLLLDEPFGALDSMTRTDMQTWLAGVRTRFDWTVLLITHDIREAVFLSDRVVVLGPRPTRVRREVVDRPAAARGTSACSPRPGSSGGERPLGCPAYPRSDPRSCSVHQYWSIIGHDR